MPAILKPPITLSDNSVEMSHLTADLKERIVKGWINFNGTGVIVIRDSFNVDSIVDNGTGDYTVNWDTDFANANYSIEGWCSSDSAAGGIILSGPDDGVLVGSTELHALDAGGAVRDVDYVCISAMGDQ